MFLPFICIADCYADDLSVIIVCELYLATKAVLDLESEGLITDGKWVTLVTLSYVNIVPVLPNLEFIPTPPILVMIECRFFLDSWECSESVCSFKRFLGESYWANSVWAPGLKGKNFYLMLILGFKARFSSAAIDGFLILGEFYFES